MASRMLSRASASVAPWDQQPGNPGHETEKPSSDASKATLYREVISTSFYDVADKSGKLRNFLEGRYRPRQRCRISSIFPAIRSRASARSTPRASSWS